MSCITQDEYNRIESDLDAPADQVGVHQDEVDAVFYLLLPEPNADPRRFKVGFATDVSERIRKFKTIAPYVRLVKTWPCKGHWEKAAIDCATQDCEQIHTEVFRSDAIEQVVERADKFFELMPTVSGTAALPGFSEGQQ